MKKGGGKAREKEMKKREGENAGWNEGLGERRKGRRESPALLLSLYFFCCFSPPSYFSIRPHPVSFRFRFLFLILFPVFAFPLTLFLGWLGR